MKKRGPRARVSTRLDALGPGELRALIECLLVSHPHLAADIDRIVTALAAVPSGPGRKSKDGLGPEIGAMATQLEEELSSLDTLDLTRPRHDPFARADEANDIWDRLHQAVAPSIEAMLQLIRLGRQLDAMRVLQAILVGLYRARDGDGELLAGAPDFPDETARWVWESWQRATHHRVPLPEEFVQRHLPEWRWLVSRRRIR